MKKKQVEKPLLPAGCTLIDTHCHLDMGAYENSLESVVRDAADAGVTEIITVGIDVASSYKAIEIAKRYPGIFATVGLHPHNATGKSKEVFDHFRALALDKKNKVVGYGEIGLDFAKEYAPRKEQVQSFEEQLSLARELGLPIIIHDRDAHDEVLAILKDHAPYPALGVMHCFSGDIRLAEKVIDLGLYISIPGIVTFNKSEAMQEVAQNIPLERLILETDGPFLSPVPFRGKINKPEYLLYTAQKVASLRRSSLADVTRQTTANTHTLFRLNEYGTST